MSQSFYEILGVPGDATQSQILDAFLAGIVEARPDSVVSADPNRARERYVAFSVLTRPTDREQYDLALAGGKDCPWCGNAVSRADLEDHVTDHVVKKADEGCVFCGRLPARYFEFRANLGRGLWHKVQRFEGNLCKTCATGVYRAMQIRNVTRGPWGIVSFFTTPYLIARNWLAHRKRSSLPGPWPHDPKYDRGRGLGRPALRSPAVWTSFLGVGAVIVLATAVIIASVGAPAGAAGEEADQPTSTTVAGIDGWVVGGCATFGSGGRVFQTECGDHRAVVVALVPTAAECPENSDFSIPLSEGVACFDQI